MSLEWLARKNTAKLKSRGNYGVRVARPGFDASTCAENQLLFNSGWPILQLRYVVDLEKNGETYTRYEHVSDGVWVDTLPSGYTKQYEYEPVNAVIGANKTYVRLETLSATYFNDDWDSYTQHTYVRAKHRSSFVPFFIPATDVAGEGEKKALIFNVDLQTDVDYPYTEAPTPLLKAPRDYGMKSTSIFGGRVSGLSTGQFSKLVHAVKTETTATYTASSEDGAVVSGKICVWSPLESGYKDAVTENVLEPYECYVFTANDTGEEGGVYYEPEAGRIECYDYTNASSPGPYAFVGMGQSLSLHEKQTMVILRSPMVSPEVEELTV